MPSPATKAKSKEKRMNYFSDRFPTYGNRGRCKRWVVRFIRYMSNRWRRFAGRDDD